MSIFQDHVLGLGWWEVEYGQYLASIYIYSCSEYVTHVIDNTKIKDSVSEYDNDIVVTTIRD